jgi:hypothetical protein
MSVVMESASGADYDFGHESAQHIDNEWRFDILKFTLGLYARAFSCVFLIPPDPKSLPVWQRAKRLRPKAFRRTGTIASITTVWPALMRFHQEKLREQNLGEFFAMVKMSGESFSACF